MARGFRLAALLRLRHAQQDQAGAALAAAGDRLREAADERLRARRTLADSPSTVTDAATLSAVAAARASTRGMLVELDAVAGQRRTDLDAAQAAYATARRAALGLEKLEARHAEQAAADDLRAEQVVLDEIATTRRRDPEADPEVER